MEDSDLFHVNKKIGEGTYGIVYEIQDQHGQKYAYKRFLSQLSSYPACYTEAEREANILSILNGNPCIVKLKMISIGHPPMDKPLSPIKSEDRNKVTEDLLHFLFENGASNLRSWLNQNPITLEQSRQFMVDILLGVEFISLSGILHRDLNPSNILIFPPSPDPLSPLENPFHRAKICDFGLAMYDVPDGKRTPGTVTPWYRAPEIIGEDRFYGTKSDAWSVGCIFYEMFFRCPFTGKVNDSKNELVGGILRNALYKLSEHEIRNVLRCERRKQTSSARPIKPRLIANKTIRGIIQKKKIIDTSLPIDMDTERITTELSQVITSLLIIDPEKRSSVTEVLDMPFFSSHREYISLFRQRHPPRSPYEYEYDIRDTKARRAAAEYMISIFNQQNDYSWYSHRALFHAIDIFDRDIRYHERVQKPIQTPLEGELHFFCCLYRSIRFYATLSPPIEITDILPNHIQREKANITRLIELETVTLLDVTDNYSFYRYGLYEAISELKTGDKETLYREGLNSLCQYPEKVNGKTPTMLAHKLSEEYCK